MRLITAAQLRMARAALGWSRVRAAAELPINRNILGELESGSRSMDSLSLKTLDSIREVFEARGVVFSEDDEGGLVSVSVAIE